MTETKKIGLTWEPNLPFTFTTTASSKASSSSTNPQLSGLYRPKSELVDGLFVPPNNPKKLNQLARKLVKDNSDKEWGKMPAAVLTPELKQDLQLLKFRNVLDPKRHYKKSDKSKTLSKHVQVGTVVESAADFYSSRLTKKERKTRIADELLADTALAQYRKRKVREIEEVNRPNSNAKWKIRGKQTQMRAKDRRKSLQNKKRKF